MSEKKSVSVREKLGLSRKEWDDLMKKWKKALKTATGISLALAAERKR